MKTCFSEGKRIKQFRKPSLSKRTPLSTNPPISEQFFHDPLFVEISKTRTPPLILGGGGGGEETMLRAMTATQLQALGWLFLPIMIQFSECQWRKMTRYLLFSQVLF